MLRRILSVTCGLAGWLLAVSAPARAQGCIMCYTSAQAASKSVQAGLRSGVLTLLVPVTLLLLSFALMVWRRATPATTS